MSKQEIYLDYLRKRYEGIENILNNWDGNEYSEEDVNWYMRFKDSNKTHNSFQDWLMYRQLINKIKRVGINGVLMRNDVQGTHIGTEDDNKGHITKYIIVETNYGDVWVGPDGKQIIYVR